MHLKGIVAAVVLLSLLITAGCNSNTENQPEKESAEVVSPKKKVTPENFIRAETDKMFYAVTSPPSEGINRFYHFRTVTPLDMQRVVRMNRDVLYSSAVVDVEKGATVTFPAIPKGRYASILIVDNDHYCSKVIYEPGTYEIPNDTKYMFLAVRIQLFNPKDSNEIALVSKLQDQFIIKSNSADKFPEPAWEMTSLDSLHKVYEAEFVKYDKYPDDWMGAKGAVNEKTRHLACAGAWGLFPNKDATYMNYVGNNLSANECYTATYKVPDVGAFWSITVYGNDGFMKSENCIINSSNAKYNKDKTFTVHYGAPGNCPANAKNRLDISDGWNLLLRCYLPGKEIREGTYQLTEVTKVD